MKLKSLILALITILPTLGFAAVFGDFEYTASKAGVIINKFNGSNASVEIPSKINSVRVTSIGESAFDNSISLNAFQTLFTAPALSYFGIQPIETAVCFVNFPYLKACERVKDVQISQLIQNSTFKGKYNNGS